MHMLVDMASSPQYLVPSAQNPDHLDIDPRIINGLSDGSCAGIAPSSVGYSNSEQTSYSEVSHLSPYETASVFDDHLLTPVSSAASPQLQQRSSKQSPFAQHRELTPCPQQPTPPNSTVMYSSYSDYGTSSMPMQTTLAEAPSELLSYHQHHYGSPGPQHHPHQHHHQHEDPQAQPTPPQDQPYYGALSVAADQTPEPYYHLAPSAIENPLGLLRADVSAASYNTHHRALAPLPPTAAPMATLLHPAPPAPQPLPPSGPQYRREPGMPLPRLTPSSHHHSHNRGHSRQSSISLRRDPARKAKARRNNISSTTNKNYDGSGAGSSNSRRSSLNPPPQQPAPGEQQFRYGEGPSNMATEDGSGPADYSEEVTLDDKTPSELRRLWDTRRSHLGKKGNGMWDDIMEEYYGQDCRSENKKTQLKAALQMKIHRMLLKHGQWPAKDEAALLRAYRRWEESRYIEILRLYEEEMAGERKGYEWKSQHVEAQLVKMGLEEPERDRESKARKRKQVGARHTQARGTSTSVASAAYRQNPNHNAAARIPDLFDGYNPHQYGGAPAQQQLPTHHVHQAPHYDPRFEVTSLVEQLGAQPLTMTEEQQDRLVDEVMERDGDGSGGGSIDNPSTHHVGGEGSNNNDNSSNGGNKNTTTTTNNNNSSFPSHPNNPSILNLTNAFDDEPHSNTITTGGTASNSHNHNHDRTTVDNNNDDDDVMEIMAVRSLQQLEEPNYSHHHPQGHGAHAHHRHSHSLSSDASRPRSAAARGGAACADGEMLLGSPQHFGQGVGA